MKYALILLMAFGLSSVSMAQVPATVNNNTGCTVQVRLIGSPAGCGLACSSASFCVFPGGSVTIPGCGLDFWVWDLAIVTPTTDDCMTPCPGPPALASPIGCLGVAPVVGANHCHCGAYTVDFSNPAVVNIF